MHHMEKTWPDVQLVFSYESGLTVAMANERRMLLNLCTCLLTASALTPSTRVGVKMAVAVLSGGKYMLLLGLRMLREKRNINAMEGLNIRAFGPDVMETDDQFNARRVYTLARVLTHDTFQCHYRRFDESPTARRKYPKKTGA